MIWLIYILSTTLALSIVWLIAPDTAMAYFNEIPKVLNKPGEMVMCGSIVACVLLAWPWTEDGRIYFRDLREECEYRGRWKEDICAHYDNKGKDFVCCSAVCPKLKEEKERRDARQS
jgi:hypothetical protein